MLISNNYSLKFTSRNNPIRDFKISTPMGELEVKEFTPKDAQNRNKLRNLAKFFLDGFISNTNDPSFLQYKEPQNKRKYVNAINTFTDYYQNVFNNDDGNLTVLVAKNKKGKIAGAVITNTMKEAGIEEKSTCYVDSIAVDSKYRRNKVGQILQDKAIMCSKDVYSDVFLVSDNMAVDFQLSNGFKKMEENNLSEKQIIDILADERIDYPDYVSFMYKKLPNAKDKTPWYERIKLNIK